ncbi:Hypothetical predicted protein [Mytilus galloprovincialis]|uniref:Uncharacterized protein n=1 Tax=Mytilus galloprovincialis TaxID=29158 RepID=A0A8B6CSJ4_MYTGA|nr:Hypothetical predicted protein [Mytilus galloprovincialis]
MLVDYQSKGYHWSPQNAGGLSIQGVSLVATKCWWTINQRVTMKLVDYQSHRYHESAQILVTSDQEGIIDAGGISIQEASWVGYEVSGLSIPGVPWVCTVELSIPELPWVCTDFYRLSIAEVSSDVTVAGGLSIPGIPCVVTNAGELSIPELRFVSNDANRL